MINKGDKIVCVAWKKQKNKHRFMFLNTNQKVEVTEGIKPRTCDVTLGNGIHFELENTKKGLGSYLCQVKVGVRELQLLN